MSSRSNTCPQDAGRESDLPRLNADDSHRLVRALLAFDQLEESLLSFVEFQEIDPLVDGANL